MGILSEDVIIRLLVDTNKGVADLKKADTQTKNLMKSALKMASAMGGAALAFELVVKAGKVLIDYLKASEKAYVDLIKSNADYVKGAHSEIDAIDDLAAAKLHLSEVNGKIIAELLESTRARRAENIELRASYLDNASLTEVLIGSARALISTRDGMINYKTAIIEANAAGKEHVITLDEQRIAMDALARASKALDDLYGVEVSQTTINLTEQLKALSSQYGLMTAEQQINYTAAQRMLALDKLIADQTEENTFLFAEAGFTYSDVASGIEKTRLEQLKLLNAMEETETKVPAVADVFDEAFGTDVTDQRIAGFNALAGALNGFLSTAFGDSKEAASVMAVINGALAITNVLANVLPPFNFIAAGLVAATTAVQIAKINSASFADGTPAGGYVVPPGYNDDSYPVSAKSGETVSISRAGEGGGGDVQITIMLDSSVLARTTTNLIKNRKIVIRQSDVVAA